MKPDKTMPRRAKETALDRIEYCRLMLGIHGFLSDSEEKKVKQCIKKWCEKNGFKVESVPLAGYQPNRREGKPCPPPKSE